MQPQDESDKCTEAGAGDGRRNAERSALENALGLAASLLSGTGNRPVHLEPGKPVNLSANLKGSGGLSV